MKNLIIKTQKEWDGLPASFEDFTRIEIRSSENILIKKNPDNSRAVLYNNSSAVLYNNSSAELWGNSRAELYNNSRAVLMGNSRAELVGNSSVELRDNSSAVLYQNSFARVFSGKIERLLDYSTAYFHECPQKIGEVSDNATVKEVSKLNISFEEWMRRGYVVADGISKKLISCRKKGSLEIFKCEEFLDNSHSFVVKQGSIFSHGKTLKQAIEDLKFKLDDRDKSDFEIWRDKPNMKLSEEDAIKGYRVITGACEEGVKDFLRKVSVPKKITPKVVLKLTNGHYGNDSLKSFLEVE